jgi:Leucine-rich repeat (LRR) protein
MTKQTDDEALIRLIDQAAAEGWEELNLSGRGLSSLPPEIWKLTGLKKLDLSINQITEIPEAIAALTNLTVLALAGNRIKIIP